eukprot:14606835-Alexandrium_andersonii.AAC.1
MAAEVDPAEPLQPLRGLGALEVHVEVADNDGASVVPGRALDEHRSHELARTAPGLGVLGAPGPAVEA